MEPVAESECALGPVERMDVDAGTLALSLDAGGGLAVALHQGTLTARRLSPEGRAVGEMRNVALPGATALLALERRGPGYMVLSRGPCEARAHCVIAAMLDAEGGSLGEPLAVPLPEAIRTSRRALSDEALFFAWSTLGGHRAVERFEVSARGTLTHVRFALGDAPPSEESPVEILGLAADGDAFAALWRSGPMEDLRSEVFLTSATTHREVHALHEALALDAIALSGETLSLVATFEFSRPHFLRIRVGEEEPDLARELAHGAPVPDPFSERERGALEVDERGLWLRRRTAAGDPIGAGVRVAEGRIASAALARRGDLFVAGWRAGGVVEGRSVRCP